ncbi:MAG: DMT family transporter [Rhizobiaceae bacterium]|jgi:drug/metabolite transporter (DMT)-like permease|nr:DMT family transporter [Rhizobiaceae bacterium]
MTIFSLRESFNRLPNNVKGGIFLMFAAAGFGVMIALIKLVGEHLHVTQILLVRQFVMTIVVIPAIVGNFPGSLKTKAPGLQVLRIILALIAMGFGFTAVVHMPLADATAIGFAKSFFVTICAIFFLNEIIGWRRWMAVLIGFAGVLLVLRPGMEGFNIYGLYALIGAAGAGAVMVVIRILTRTENTTTILTYQALGVGLAMLVPGLYFWQWPTAFEWGLLIAMGLISYVAQLFNITAYKYGEASVMASLDYVRLVYSVIFGYFLFNNLPDVWTWVGAMIIIGASIYTIHREGKKDQVLLRSPEGRGKTP